MTTALAPGAVPPAAPGSTPVVVAVDVGGTTLKGAVVDAAGAVLGLRVVPTRSPGTSRGTSPGAPGGDVEASLHALVADLVTDARDAGREASGIGVASPGLVDAEGGTVEFAANLGWRGYPLVAALTERFALPARVDHDARAGLLAERSARRDALTGALPRDMAFVPVGTGIASAVVTGGAVLTGGSGAAGELGHVVVVPGGERCACAQRGCVEAYASAASIARRYTARGGGAGATAADVAARLGHDDAADAVWAEAVTCLAQAVGALTAIVDPRLVVVGGGLSQAGPALADPLAAALGSALPWRQPPQLDLSRVGPGAGLVGAALLALDAAGAPAADDFHQRVRSGAGALQHAAAPRATTGGRR